MTEKWTPSQGEAMKAIEEAHKLIKTAWGDFTNLDTLVAYKCAHKWKREAEKWLEKWSGEK